MRAHVEWDGYHWVAEPETGGVTQSKRLSQLPERLSEVAKLMTGAEVDPGAWDLEISYGDLGERAAAVRRRRSEIEEAEAQLAADTRDTVRALRSQGMSLRDIGVLLGVSYQRAHQLVS